MTTINCTTLKDIDNALQSSWCGDSVIAIYNGITYNLYADVSETDTNGAHMALMQIVNPAITASDTTEDSLRKYDSSSSLL